MKELLDRVIGYMSSFIAKYKYQKAVEDEKIAEISELIEETRNSMLMLRELLIKSSRDVKYINIYNHRP